MLQTLNRQTVGVELPEQKKDRVLVYDILTKMGEQSSFELRDTLRGHSLQVIVGNYEIYITTGVDSTRLVMTTWQNTLRPDSAEFEVDRIMVSQIECRGLDKRY